MIIVLLLFIAFGASVIGGICGIGGGVLMKPILDLYGVADVSTISFLSSMTVLAMTGYTTMKNLVSGSQSIDLNVTGPLALGAAFGGIIGKALFEIIKKSFQSSGAVGAVQSVILAFLTLGTLIYTINKKNVKSLCISNKSLSIIIGLLLGLLSSFLGIGGGPFNLLFLFFFFSMTTKEAVPNSHFIILFSQLFSLLYMVFCNKIPHFNVLQLTVMISGGIIGGIVGRKAYKKMDDETVNRLFLGLLGVIILICIYNAIKYLK